MPAYQVSCLGADSATKVNHLTTGEVIAKTTYQRSSNGPVVIAECSADGKYVVLENTGHKVHSHKFLKFTTTCTACV